MAGEAYPAPARPAPAGHDVDQGGFPGPVRAHHAQCLALGHRQADAVQHLQGAELLMYVLDLQQRHNGRSLALIGTVGSAALLTMSRSYMNFGSLLVCHCAM